MTVPVNLHGLHQHTGLPLKWLREEAEAGRLPALRVGNALFFNIEAVYAVLLQRAATGSASADNSALAEAENAARDRHEDAINGTECHVHG